jgi:hypothetical protein
MSIRTLVLIQNSQLPSEPDMVLQRRDRGASPTGVTVQISAEYTRRTAALHSANVTWACSIGEAREAVEGLRSVRARFCPSLTQEWFDQLVAMLRELYQMNAPVPGPDGMTFKGLGLPHRALALLDELDKRQSLLADTTPAAPRALPDLVVLGILSRDPLRLSELPPDIGAKHLRALDMRGWVVVRPWACVDDGSTPDNYRTRESPVGGWYSPCKAEVSAGDTGWDALFLSIAPPWNPAAEVKVTEEGLAALDTAAIAAQIASDEPMAEFKRGGRVWHIGFNGRKASLPHRAGLAHIAALLAEPHPVKPLAATALQGRTESDLKDQHGAQSVVDDESMKDLREEIADVERQLEESGTLSEAECERLSDQLADLKQHRIGLLGIGKRTRSFDYSLAEKDRKAVTTALSRAYEELRNADPPMTELADHLQSAIRADGQSFAYRPPPPIPTWTLL